MNIREMSKYERADDCRNRVNQTSAEHIINNHFLTWLLANKFFEMPASTKYHLNYEGGLYEHSLNVMNVLVELTENNKLTWQRPESPYIVGMFHDLCKHDAYLEDGFEHWAYNEKQILKGHGDKSVMLLSQFMSLTEEEIMCIRYHMGPYEKEAWEQYDLAIRKYPNVLWTHQADMIASKLIEK